MFSFEELVQILAKFISNVFDNEEFINKIAPEWVEVYKLGLKKYPDFFTKDEVVFYTNKLDSFEFSISEQIMEKIFTNMYLLANHILQKKQSKSDFISKAKAQFKIFNVNFMKLIEKNLKIAIVAQFHKLRLYYRTSVTSLGENRLESLFLEKFIEKNDLGSLFYLKYIQKMNDNACVTIIDTDEMISEIKKLLKTMDESKYKSSREKFIFQAITTLFENYTSELVLDKNGNLLVSDIFEKLFMNCLKSSNKRFIVTFFSFKTEGCFHQNILIYDRQNNEIERFEPNGNIAYETMEECQDYFQTFDLFVCIILIFQKFDRELFI